MCREQGSGWAGIGVIFPAVLSVVVLALPVWASPGVVPVPTDSNVSAVVARIWKALPGAGGLGEQTLTYPYAACLDSEGRLFILDLGPSEGVYTTDIAIYVLNKNRQVEAIIGNTPTATIRTPQIKNPMDIAVDSKGRLYICDANMEVVHILGHNLSYLGYLPIPEGGTPGYPRCIALDSKDRLIVGQSRAMFASRMLVFAPNQTDPVNGQMVLEKIFQLPPPDPRRPSDHGVPTDVTVDPFDRIIIAERSTQYMSVERVAVLDPDFNWVMGVEVGTPVCVSSAVVHPSGVFVVSSGATICFFLPNGTYAGRMGRAGSQPGEFQKIGRLMVAESGSLLVPDGGNGRIQEIVVDTASLRPASVVREPVVELALSSVFLVLCGVWRRRPRFSFGRCMGVTYNGLTRDG